MTQTKRRSASALPVTPELRIAGTTVPYATRQSPRATNWALRIVPGLGLEVVVPYGADPSGAHAFIVSHAAWVLRHLSAVQRALTPLPAAPARDLRPVEGVFLLDLPRAVVPYRIRVSARARRVGIRIAARCLELVLPSRDDLVTGQALLRSHAAWVATRVRLIDGVLPSRTTGSPVSAPIFPPTPVSQARALSAASDPDVIELAGLRVPYTVRHSVRASQAALRILPTGLELVVPRNGDTTRARTFLAQKEAWLLTHLEQLRRFALPAATSARRGGR